MANNKKLNGRDVNGQETPEHFKMRIIARGEHSNNAHIVTGISAVLEKVGDTVRLTVPQEGQEDYEARFKAVQKMKEKIASIKEPYGDPVRMELTTKYGQEYEEEIKGLDRCVVVRHLMETNFLAGEMVWTKEHLDIPFPPGSVIDYCPQVSYNPLTEAVERVRD